MLPDKSNFVKQGIELAKSLSRLYSSSRSANKNPARTISQKTSDGTDKVKKAFEPLVEELRAHEANNPEFYKYLEEQSKVGFNKKQYDIFAAVFCARTIFTIPSVASYISKAALRGDSQAVFDAAQNLYEESGSGNPDKMHSNLLLRTFNTHGSKIYGSKPYAKLKDVEKSLFLLEVPELTKYTKEKHRIFNSSSYPLVAGNTWAHEFTADNMLDTIRRTLFVPYKGYYKPDEYVKLTEYFTEHKDDTKEDGDVEANHERMARAAAERACEANINNIPKIRSGALAFLDAQAALWNGLMREMFGARNVGVPIPPKPDSPTKPDFPTKPDSPPNPIATKTGAITLQEKSQGSKVSSTDNSIWGHI